MALSSPGSGLALLVALWVSACATSTESAELPIHEPASDPAPVTIIPNACIDDPWADLAPTIADTLDRFDPGSRADVLRALPTPEGRGQLCAASQPFVDLDGDGVEERDLTVGCAWNKVWPHILVLSNHGCPIYGGWLMAAEALEPLPSPDPMPPLQAYSSAGCAGWDVDYVRYAFTDAGYQPVERATCSWCEDDRIVPNDNDHPACVAAAGELELPEAQASSSKN